jgi:tRNA (guanine37-N1)-methyltransferase
MTVQHTPRFDVIGLFPEIITVATRTGVLGRGLQRGVLVVEAHQLRDYTGGSPHPVDDEPYGGGPGLVMRPEPIYAAIEDVCRKAGASPGAPWKILMSPQGERFDQHHARRLRERSERASSIVIFCGRYEGVDERVRGLFDQEISLGDFVLTGGELAAAAMIDAVARLIPGVLGCGDSTASESFAEDELLEYPQYTRPVEFRGLRVPVILQSGDHGAIRRWRREQSIARTRVRRPDLAKDPGDESS